MRDSRQLSPEMFKIWGTFYDEKRAHTEEEPVESKRGDNGTPDYGSDPVTKGMPEGYKAPPMYKREIGDPPRSREGKSQMPEGYKAPPMMPSPDEAKRFKQMKRLLDKIGGVESAKGYNNEYGNKSVPLDKMTLSQVLEHQQKRRSQGAKSSAVGRYQFIHSTLNDIAQKNPKDFPMDALFTPEMQDKAAMLLMKRRGMDDFLSGKMDDHTFAKNLSKEWASLPDPDTGRSYYAGDGLNKSLVSTESIFELMKGIKAG
jgi:muramidase (phage lysozyme)